jgi:hypothetical protein
MSTRRRFIPALLLLTGFTISACSAFFVPNQDDDGVERCNNSDDCDNIPDNRYVAQCTFGEGQPESASKVCVADFAIVPCGGQAYGGEHILDATYKQALMAQAAYARCSDENRGKRGCPPPSGGQCDPGLSVGSASTICEDPDDPIPAIYPPDVGGIDIAGQDVKDQFCRWFFCDDTFVCDNTGSRAICRRCSGTDPKNYGNGACGEIYIQGEPSPFYTSLSNANCSGNKPTTEALFGPAPVVDEG